MQIIEDDPDRIIADRLYVGDTDMPTAGNQNLLSWAMSLYFRGWTFYT